MGDSIFSLALSLRGITILAVVAIIVASCYLMSAFLHVRVIEMIHRFVKEVLKKLGNIIGKREEAYHRDIEIGKLNEKQKKVKMYRFLNDLIIDLGLSTSGITPYELITFILIGSMILSIVLASSFFVSTFVAIPLYPVVVVMVVCMLYTRANIAHDRRIEAVITAENIVCNNVQSGVIAAMEMNLDIIPEEVRPYFRECVDNVKVENYHTKTALLKLNMELGAIADEFIKKCISFELEEESTESAGMFNDIVELNNARTAKRIEIKHELDHEVTIIKINGAMIFSFLIGVLAIFGFVRDLYFNTAIGNIVIMADLLLLLIIYVICTVIKATEL